ncbi:hypothetical protein AVT43_gp11 [Polaribacter phage P12002L]|uniref:Uncharacterized protein n=2 Tax=Incheonvirus TaxID=2976977 RepID=A0A0F7IN80_9CAUD|nr:hypothetical protein AVT42_gp11 [Polaribacter phage P12002S]YP_009209671.1 hypothetical protein AVT43_gp11 [Polaribacter phage P12002L]AKG94185.1 hypothetical protein P12002L_0011 [Polaribacter phage P12002L]AKG94267.1 hypothetical protein P12002S_0011 [Polaribacter phage P12002S]
MEYTLVEKLGYETYEGKPYEKKRISLINPKNENILGKAQSYFTRKEKKEAKLNYKNK